MGNEINEQSTAIADVLRLADRRFKKTARAQPREVLSVVRRALGALAQVHTFYAGFFFDEQTLLIPYEFRDGAERGTDISIFGPLGLSQWIRRSGRAYRFAQDEGRLCLAGVPSDDGVSVRDAVALPAFSLASGHVIGMFVVEGTRAGTFGDDFVHAFEWLVRASTACLDLGDLGQSPEIYESYPGLDSSAVQSPVEILQRATDHLASIEHAAQAATSAKGGGHTTLEAIGTMCHEAGADLSLMALRLGQREPDPSPVAMGLSRREHEIANLIIRESLSNAALAERLFVSEKTIKTHVSSILRKTGARQRSELGWLLA